MSESYVQLPGNSTGSRMRTISGSIGGSVVEMEVVLIGDSGSYATITPAKTQQFPSTLTTGGNLKVAIVEGSSGSSTVTANIGTDIGKSITGSIGLSITGSTLSSVTTTVPITGSISGGSVGITGSSTLSVAVVSGMSGSNSTARSITGSIGLSVTGSTLSGISVTVPITGSISGGSIGITGSNTLNVAIVSGMTGSTSTASSITGSIGLSVTGSTLSTVSTPIGITGSLTSLAGGSIGITGSSTLTVIGSVGISGSVGLTTSGSLLDASGSLEGGVMIIGSGSSQRIKVYQAGYTTCDNSFHWFFFGNKTGSYTTSASKFMLTSGSGIYRQTFVQPVISGLDEALYIYSSGSDIRMGVDLSYVIE